MFHLLAEGIGVPRLLLPPAVPRSPSSFPNSKVALSKDTHAPPLEAGWDPEVFQLEMLLLSKDRTWVEESSLGEACVSISFMCVIVSFFSLLSFLFPPSFFFSLSFFSDENF